MPSRRSNPYVLLNKQKRRRTFATYALKGIPEYRNFNGVLLMLMLVLVLILTINEAIIHSKHIFCDRTFPAKWKKEENKKKRYRKPLSRAKLSQLVFIRSTYPCHIFNHSLVCLRTTSLIHLIPKLQLSPTIIFFRSFLAILIVDSSRHYFNLNSSLQVQIDRRIVETIEYGWNDDNREKFSAKM